MSDIRSTNVERMLLKYWINVEGSQCSDGFNTIQRFENKGNFVRVLNENWSQFKFGSTRFQQAFNIFYTFNNFERPVQTSPIFVSTKWWTHVEANVETVLIGLKTTTLDGKNDEYPGK